MGRCVLKPKVSRPRRPPTTQGHCRCTLKLDILAGVARMEADGDLDGKKKTWTGKSARPQHVT